MNMKKTFVDFKSFEKMKNEWKTPNIGHQKNETLNRKKKKPLPSHTLTFLIVETWNKKSPTRIKEKRHPSIYAYHRS